MRSGCVRDAFGIRSGFVRESPGFSRTNPERIPKHWRSKQYLEILSYTDNKHPALHRIVYTWFGLRCAVGHLD